jgi:hypothetical protein
MLETDMPVLVVCLEALVAAAALASAPAAPQAAFYVDPTFTGTGDGSERAPWRTLVEDGNPAFAGQWAAINRALAEGSVTVYFSARQARRDAPEELVGSVRLERTDKSDHRLTLDGMSVWNTDDAAPRWKPYTGPHRMRIRMTRGCCFSIGWDDDVARDHVTMRGFEVTGNGARIRWGGSDTVLEYIWSHDVQGVGATVQFNAAVTDWPECRDLGRCQGIVIRNNVIERGIGEGIYLAGTYTRTEDGGCPDYGITHRSILIEGNTIVDPGANGEEGDGIDLKAGLVDVTVRNNVIRNPHAGKRGADGITCLGVPGGGRTNYVIEGNIISGAKHGMILGGLNGAVIGGNVVEGCTRVGIYLCADPGRPDRAVEISRNTVLGAGVGLGEVDGVVLRHNYLVGKGRQITGWNAVGVDSDWNFMAPAGSEFPEGPHSVVREKAPAGSEPDGVFGAPGAPRAERASPVPRRTMEGVTERVLIERARTPDWYDGLGFDLKVPAIRGMTFHFWPQEAWGVPGEAGAHGDDWEFVRLRHLRDIKEHADGSWSYRTEGLYLPDVEFAVRIAPTRDSVEVEYRVTNRGERRRYVTTAPCLQLPEDSFGGAATARRRERVWVVTKRGGLTRVSGTRHQPGGKPWSQIYFAGDIPGRPVRHGFGLSPDTATAGFAAAESLDGRIVVAVATEDFVATAYALLNCLHANPGRWCEPGESWTSRWRAYFLAGASPDRLVERAERDLPRLRVR